MTFEEYQEEMKRTASKLEISSENLCLGAMGITGEAGEVADYIKKLFFIPMNYQRKSWQKN